MYLRKREFLGHRPEIEKEKPLVFFDGLSREQAVVKLKEKVILSLVPFHKNPLSFSEKALDNFVSLINEKKSYIDQLFKDFYSRYYQGGVDFDFIEDWNDLLNFFDLRTIRKTWESAHKQISDRKFRRQNFQASMKKHVREIVDLSELNDSGQAIQEKRETVLRSEISGQQKIHHQILKKLGLEYNNSRAEQVCEQAANKAILGTMRLVDDVFGSVPEGRKAFFFDNNLQSAVKAQEKNYLVWDYLAKEIYNVQTTFARENVLKRHADFLLQIENKPESELLISAKVQDFAGQDVSVKYQSTGQVEQSEEVGSDTHFSPLMTAKNIVGPVVAQEISHYAALEGVGEERLQSLFSLKSKQDIRNLINIVATLVQKLQGKDVNSLFDTCLSFDDLSLAEKRLIILALICANGGWLVGVEDESIMLFLQGNDEKAEARLSKKSYTNFLDMLVEMGPAEIFKDAAQVSQGIAQMLAGNVEALYPKSSNVAFGGISSLGSGLFS